MKTPPPQNTQGRTEIFQRIRHSEGGAISFAEYMEMALYHPDWGYYRDVESREIGRSGDFFTSVSVGDCYGNLLGWEIEKCWSERFGGPDSFTIVEQGAHDGQLAFDILAGLAERKSELAGRVRYTIIEPSRSRRSHLDRRFSAAPFEFEVEVVSSADEIRVPCGIFLCNELLDAFPVHRVRFEGGSWKELFVTSDEKGNLAWVASDMSPDADLAREVAGLGLEFPEGYATEFCLEIRDWARGIAPIFDRGIWWVIDYGFEEDEYHAPHRNRGTLQCYRDHRVTENPFDFPGETDITAHVNFTQLFREAASAGMEKTLFADQHDFLTRAAFPWLTSLEADGTAQAPENRKRLRQFQTLTHPGMMGRVFKVAEFTRGL